MTEMDPLDKVLREWETPEPSAVMDVRVRDAYRTAVTPPFWVRIWTARVSIPVPVLAGVVLLLAVGWLVEFRPAMPVAPDPAAGVVTRLEATGFVAVPDGSARVEDIKQ